MKLLAIETSSTNCSVALHLKSLFKCREQIAPMQQSQLFLQELDQLLTENHVKLSELNAIAFGCGPGSFTGIRLATAIAQSLGFALNIPLISVSSLAAIAQAGFMKYGWRKIIVCVDARMNEIYHAPYIVNHHGLAELFSEEKVCKPTNAPQLDDSWYGAGNGWESYKNDLTNKFKPLNVDSELVPSAEGILKLALPKFLEQIFTKPAEAFPIYLRDEVAVKQNKS